MECEGLDSGSGQMGLHVGSDEKPELGLGVEGVSAKHRIRNMECEEKRSGSKKRSKLIQVGRDSDDDEPIGSLFKVKGKRNPKKVKTGSEGVGEKGQDVEVRGGNLGVVDEDLGVMNDTLASFKKKLKGPKKDSGSGKAAGRRSLGIIVTEPSSLNGPVKDGGLTMETKIVENGKVIGEDGSDGSMSKELGNRVKEKTKRSKGASKRKKTALAGQGFLDDSIQNHTEYVLGSSLGPNHCLNDNLEDSLSTLFQKAQSDLSRKSRMRSRQRRETQAPKNRLNSDDVSDGIPPVFLGRYRSASNLALEFSHRDDSFCLVSGRIPIDSDHCQNKIGIRQSSDESMQKSLSSSDEMLERSSTRVVTDLNMQSRDNMHGVPEAALEESVPTSFSQRSQSYLTVCSSKTARREESDSNHLQDGDSKQFLSVKVKDESSEPTTEIKNVKGIFRAIDSGHDFVEIPDSIPVPVQKEETHQLEAVLPNAGFNHPADQQSKSGLSPLSFCVVHKSEFGIPIKREEKSMKTGDNSNLSPPEHCLNEFVTPDLICRPSVHHSQPFDDVPKDTCVQSHDYLSGNGEANGASSSPSVTPDRSDSYAEGKGHLPDPEFMDKKQSVAQRSARKVKQRRHEDMAYEGDVDWEVLIHEQGFLESRLVGDGDQCFRAREKFNSLSNTVAEAENAGAAAVSAGLKACAVGPVEKIKFKEVLKRKGGLQEYLQCRNKILGLWSKDVSRVLPLTECGVTSRRSADESLCASLVREIYAFLDQSGYINAGVASEKDRSEPSAMHNFKLSKEKNSGEKAGNPDADTDDGVSFILGRVRSSEVCIEEKNGELDDQNLAAGARKDRKLVGLQSLEFSTITEPDKYRADELHGNGFIDAKSPDRMVKLDILSSNPSCKILDIGAVPVITSEGVQTASCGCLEGDHGMHCDSDGRKRIIVIGAGPAGLAAARHLQRHGFSVTVLEARSRVGGRVYTDRSSLSVPVDLGASIITGVEADVATERRPDPSSLVCAQLGLELTVLNSDCPLYDIVSGQKVPADLDEALEAEYNSLLDDTLLLVAQKGEQAMKMSLGDGLEYALRRRRMARLGRNYLESETHNAADVLVDSENNCSNEEKLSPLERRVMDWHFANLEYGCAAVLKEVSLPYWNQDDVYGGFGGAHCMIKGGYSTVVESLGEGLRIHLNHVVTDISYHTNDCRVDGRRVKVSTSNGRQFSGDAVLITVPLGCLKAEAIRFSPPLPQWKHLAIQRLGFGVLNKVVLEFPEVFWDNSVDYFGATAEETNQRGQCFMFWNVKKTVGAPVLIALVVGKAAIDGQNMSSCDHVNRALTVLRKLFGVAAVPDPVASVVTDWGNDPYSYGAYSYVAVGASGEDYDILGRPVENCLFFAGEATCKEHPDTVGGAMMSGLREAVRIMDILYTGNDYTAEVEAMEAAQRHSDSERNEVRDLVKRLEAVELSNVLYKNSLDGADVFTRETLLQDMFFNAKTTTGRLHLAKELLNLPVEALKSFAGTKEGLSTLNSWILDSMGKDGTQLLRHCVRLLVLVSTDLLAVRLSGIGKTVKEKVCVHTSRDIRAIASQLVNVWIEVFRKEKASNGGLKLLKQSSTSDSLKSKALASTKLPLRVHHGLPDNKGSSQIFASAGSHLPPSGNVKRVNAKSVKLERRPDSKLEVNKSSTCLGFIGIEDAKGKEEHNLEMSEAEQAAFAAAEAARAAALAAAEAYASSEAKCNPSLPLPKILSFHKFARREEYAKMDESDFRRKWSGGALGKQDCTSEIDSRNCRVRDWSVDFSAACANLDSSKMSVDNLSQQSHSNEIACQLNFREQSGESAAVDSSIFTKAWVDAEGSVGIKDYNAIDRWQSQAAAAESDFFHRTMQIRDEEDSNMNSKPPSWKREQLANESSVSQVTVSKELIGNQPRGAERIKQAVVDYVASLLMPLYKARKIDKEGYKSIMKKTATKVMEQTTDAEKAMAVYEFLDFKRKNKIRSFVDKLIERHMAMNPVDKP
ncbi:lysine-specific histone demethylase 1 homolog 3-like [Actinidia eriantha]|uniref:lysine-specific histone demethylase 1 homolog 3-like n=1 Tax=Actinidia eriantha TaxID=165200 RepID=UPI00258730A7|nr:lysine-specific histone demethylase 1 homolog 3-like [Actinidia eriantha]